MLPPKCITCGKLLSDIAIELSALNKSLEHDDSISPEQKAQKIAQFLDVKHIKRICCRCQCLTYVELIDIII
jgi:DNA-directed RNA polymerase subunit N (RpoN/RPB10)